jgi:hypothetical protein
MAAMTTTLGFGLNSTSPSMLSGTYQSWYSSFTKHLKSKNTSATMPKRTFETYDDIKKYSRVQLGICDKGRIPFKKEKKYDTMCAQLAEENGICIEVRAFLPMRSINLNSINCFLLAQTT